MSKVYVYDDRHHVLMRGHTIDIDDDRHPSRALTPRARSRALASNEGIVMLTASYLDELAREPPGALGGAPCTRWPPRAPPKGENSSLDHGLGALALGGASAGGANHADKDDAAAVAKEQQAAALAEWAMQNGGDDESVSSGVAAMGLQAAAAQVAFRATAAAAVRR